MKKQLKILSLILAVVMVVSCLVACGMSPEKQAEQAVTSCFDAMKAGDLQTAQTYLQDDNGLLEDGESEDAAINNAMIEAVFEKLDYKILSSTKVDDATVTVKAEISNVDMKPVFTEFFTQALQYSMSNLMADPQPTEEEVNQKMEEIFNSCISKEGLEMVTKEVDIQVVKNDAGWVIDADEKLANALLGGLWDVLEELQNSFAGLG